MSHASAIVLTFVVCSVFIVPWWDQNTSIERKLLIAFGLAVFILATYGLLTSGLLDWNPFGPEMDLSDD